MQPQKEFSLFGMDGSWYEKYWWENKPAKPPSLTTRLLTRLSVLNQWRRKLHHSGHKTAAARVWFAHPNRMSHPKQ